MSDEALAWAKSTVWSRAFNIKYLGDTHCWYIAFMTSCSGTAHAV